MTVTDLGDKFQSPLSVEAAVLALSGNPEDTVLVAGGTWVMRAPLGEGKTDRVFVSLAKVPGMHRISKTATSLELGPLVTHDGLAAAVASLPEMDALAKAAGQCANPAIRRAATVGGNICTRGFDAPDLVPALIVLGATVDVQSNAGTATLSVEDYILTRADRPLSEILTTVSVPRQTGTSAHVRGLLRKAGEYPVVNVSAFVEVDKDGTIATARIAVGALEALTKRWHALERAIEGRPFSSIPVGDLAQSCADSFVPRDGIDAPGWYRLRILPRLAERAFADLARQMQEGI